MSFGFAAGYVILRELPLRNFYARALIMGWFLCKYANTMGFPFISRLMPGTVMLEGENKNWVRQLENFPLLNAAVRYQRIPNANNRYECVIYSLDLLTISSTTLIVQHISEERDVPQTSRPTI